MIFNTITGELTYDANELYDEVESSISDIILKYYNEEHMEMTDICHMVNMVANDILMEEFNKKVRENKKKDKL